MKRSLVNHRIREAMAFMETCGFHLPPFAFWSAETWAEKGPECDGIRRRRLGWDVTDFGSGAFEKTGLLLFTLRNGTPEEAAEGGKCYAEKAMVVEEGQRTPVHFHWKKREAIINRAGATLVIRIWKSDEKEGLSEAPVRVETDGTTRTVPAGGAVHLAPGESITLDPYVYHEFFAEGGRCLVGEVSSVNDDLSDNRFLEPIPRFSRLEEDTPPAYLLCNEYPSASTG